MKNGVKKFIIGVCAVMLTACAVQGEGSAAPTATASDEPVSGGTYIVRGAGDPYSFNPDLKVDDWGVVTYQNIFNRLVKQTVSNEVVGDLAESWEFTSDTSVTFKLRHGVKFHNGDEMKASDVVYSIERAQKSAKVKTFTANIASVTADDDYTVTIKTSIPYAPLMSNLCHTANSIVSQKAAEAAGDKFSASPIGTGPFKFVKWDSGDKVVLEKNADYFAGTVKPTSLTFKLMSEGSARTIALETGEVDLNLTVAASDAKRISEEDSVKLVTSMSPKIEYVSMNQKEKPFDNALVRQAINYAIDRKSLNTVASAGYGEVTDSVMNKQINGYTDDVAHYDYNPEKAKELLGQAGYKNGFETTILVSGDTRNTEAQLIQANLADVGIKVTIDTAESTAMLEQINNGDYKMFIMSYNNTTGDPDTSLYMLFNSKVPASSGNRSFTNIPEVDQKLEAARVETNADARMKIYAELQKTLTEQAVWVPLYCVPNLVGIRSGLSGYTPHPLGNDVFDQLSYE